MKKIIAISLTIVAVLLVLTLAQAYPEEEFIECRISGSGTFGCGGDQRDSFGGNAMSMKAGPVQGRWTHISHGVEAIFQGDVHYLACKTFPTLSGPDVPTAYPNYANFGGTSTFTR